MSELKLSEAFFLTWLRTVHKHISTSSAHACSAGLQSVSAYASRKLSPFSLSVRRAKPAQRGESRSEAAPERMSDAQIRGKNVDFTCFLRRHEEALEFCGRGAGTHPPSFQQSEQGSAVPRQRLAGQAGAAARRVHSTRLPLSEGARHAAAAAGLPHPLRAVLGRRLALQQRAGVARLTPDHRSHRSGEARERGQRGGKAQHAKTGHCGDEAGHTGTEWELSHRLRRTVCDTARRLAFSICVFFCANFSFYTGG